MKNIRKEIVGRIYGLPMRIRVNLIRALAGKRMVILNAYFGPEYIENLYSDIPIISGCRFEWSASKIRTW
jgi:hypothetical protein